MLSNTIKCYQMRSKFNQNEFQIGPLAPDPPTVVPNDSHVSSHLTGRNVEVRATIWFYQRGVVGL